MSHQLCGGASGGCELTTQDGGAETEGRQTCQGQSQASQGPQAPEAQETGISSPRYHLQALASHDPHQHAEGGDSGQCRSLAESWTTQKRNTPL